MGGYLVSMKNLKLNKKGLSITAALLIGTTLLSSCGGKSTNYRNYNNNNSYHYSYNDTSLEESDFSWLEDNLSFEELEDLNAKLRVDATITEINKAAFDQYLNSIEDSYHYEDLYGIDDAFARFNSEKEDDISHHKNDFIGKDNCFTYEEIYRQVVNNNEEYQQNNRAENGKVNFYKELENEQLQNACKLIAEVLNDYLKDNKVSNISELSCILSNLKVLRDNTSFSNAYVTDDDCLIISPNMLNFMDFMNQENTFNQTVIHEIEHLFQKSCQDKINKETKQVGICTRYNDLEINPLFFDWFFEASAEKEACNYLSKKPIVYENMVGYLESLSLATILYENVEVGQTERLCTTRNLDKLFEQFHCQTEQDKKNIIKMMFAIDISQIPIIQKEISQKDEQDFVVKYEKENGVTLTGDDLLAIKYEVKPDVCRTYLKSFYRSLSEATANNKIPLQDMFYLIRLTEADINNHILYSDFAQYKYNKSFIEEASLMQQEFFQSLDCGYSTNELVDMYKEYQIISKNASGEIQYNYSLNWLDDSKREYLQGRTESLLEYSNRSISSCVQTEKTKLK